MKLIVRILVVASMVGGLFTACQKEFSNENKGGGIPGGGTAEGTLGGDPDACANTVISGLYGKGLALTDSNYVTVEMDFTKAGTFYVTTDTINGIFFSSTGFVSTTGITSIVLRGAGTPLTAGLYAFTVSFKESSCTFDLKVYPVCVGNGTSDYFPSTGGNNWTYMWDYSLAGPTDTVLTTATDVAVSLGSNSYTLFTTTDNLFYLDSAFYRKGGGVYYQFGTIDITDTVDVPVLNEFIFLKDYEPVGATWGDESETYGIVAGDSVKFKYQSTLLEKNVTVLLEDNIYLNVIKVSRSEQVLYPILGWSTVRTSEYWYAKGIGMIREKIPSPNFGKKLIKYTVL